MILLIFNSLFCQYHKFKQSKKHRFTNSKKLINANDLVHLFCQTKLVEVLSEWLGLLCNPYSRFSSPPRRITSIGARMRDLKPLVTFWLFQYWQ